VNTKELIDKILLYTDDTLATDAGTSKRRIKILEWAQEVGDHFWNHQDFGWTMATTSITVPAEQGYVALPANFQKFGPLGTAYNTADWGIPMDEANPQEIQRHRESSFSHARPRIFSVYIADDGVQRFQTMKNSNELTISIYYKTNPPVLVDVDHATTSLLQYYPAGYHYSVLLAGCKERAARQKGDARAQGEWHGIYMQGLARAIANEQEDNSSSIRRLGRAMVGMH
jgi:hypothetical protein